MSWAHLRRRLRVGESAVKAAVIDRAVHAFARFRYLMPDARPSRHGVSVIRDVVYGDASEPAHALDVYIPERAPRPLPVVMYVHGGAFSMLSKDTHRVMALALSRQGFLTFNINYRLGVKNLYPAPLQDACSALLWVHRNAERFGGDPDRIAVAGESAGGNLVAALAIASATPRQELFARRVYDANIPIRAVVSTYGFHDLTDAYRFREHPRAAGWVKEMLFDAAISYVGHDIAGAVRASPLCSPLTILEGGFVPERPLPPFFLDVGTRDPLLKHSRRMKLALDAAGTRCDLHVWPGEIHGYDAMVWRHAAREKWRRVYAFLGEHLGLEARRPGESLWPPAVAAVTGLGSWRRTA
jgi:acetyl esterase